MKFLIIIQTGILFLLSGIHFSWALGSKWGIEKTLPTNLAGDKLLNPTWVDSTVVAIGLLLFAIYYLLKGNFIAVTMPQFVLNYAGWVISAIFILRAIGDFKYIGFFKSITTTDFARLDTMFYSPLCLVLGVIGVWLELR